MTAMPVQRTADKRELSKVTGYRRKSSSFPKGEKGVDFEADVLMNALCKPWELGGHPHDFLVAHRSARITDSTQFYERDNTAIKRHERMVAEKEVWNRQRAIREEMLQLLNRLHSIEKQRRHFLAVRGYNHAEFPDSSSLGSREIKHVHSHEHDASTNTQILSSTFVDDRAVNNKFLPFRKSQSQSSNGGNQAPGLLAQQKELPIQDIISPKIAAEKQEVQALDAFDLQLDAFSRENPLRVSLSLFRRNKRK